MKGIIFTVFIAIFSISNSFACNCTELNTKEAYNNSDLIFTGKLINRELKTTIIKANGIKSKQTYVRMIFTFQVIEIIKGRKHTKTVVINSKFNNIDFEKGKEYWLSSNYNSILFK